MIHHHEGVLKTLALMSTEKYCSVRQDKFSWKDSGSDEASWFVMATRWFLRVDRVCVPCCTASDISSDTRLQVVLG